MYSTVPMAPQIRVTVYCAAIIRQFLVVLVRLMVGLMVLKWVSSPRSPTFARGNCPGVLGGGALINYEHVFIFTSSEHEVTVMSSNNCMCLLP